MGGVTQERGVCHVVGGVTQERGVCHVVGGVTQERGVCHVVGGVTQERGVCHVVVNYCLFHRLEEMGLHMEWELLDISLGEVNHCNHH